MLGTVIDHSNKFHLEEINVSMYHFGVWIWLYYSIGNNAGFKEFDNEV